MFALATNEALYCIECNFPARLHDRNPDCWNDPSMVRDFPDYWFIATKAGENARPLVLTEGPASSQDTVELYPEEPEGHDNYWEAIDQYRDLYPQEHTSAISWTHVNRSGRKANGEYPTTHPARTSTLPLYIETGQTRNVYVEGFSGFTAQQLVDFGITEAYQNRLLNVFVDKRSRKVRVGGIELTKNTDLTVTARCVQNSCGCTLTVPLNTDRESMETFVLAVIRHGNNHAAAWFRYRDTFYKVHSQDCKLNCDPKAAHCLPLKEAVNV